jgi:predicted nucleic acid-binding protein
LGIVVDTSNLVAAERRGHSVGDILQQLELACGRVTVAVAAITFMELAHGIARARTEAQRRTRRIFLDDLRDAVSVYPLTSEIAELAGEIAGTQAERGMTLPLADLLIGATALHYGAELITDNTRHFELIPNLTVRKI